TRCVDRDLVPVSAYADESIKLVRVVVYGSASTTARTPFVYAMDFGQGEYTSQDFTWNFVDEGDFLCRLGTHTAR
ncbi:hypothetical protein FRC12_010969, partial [Ceratobasidium sp. 428]